jgi:hypothetical protein
MRVAIWASLLLPLLGTTSILADEGEMGPLEIVADCIEAAGQRDFARYVDHLSTQEQQVQAGYALLVASVSASSIESGDDATAPETYLLVRALKDLVQQYSPADGQWDSDQQAAQQVRQQMVGRWLSANLTQPTFYASAYGTAPIPFRAGLIQSTGVLKEPRQFLIAVLEELARPTLVSGAVPARKAAPNMCTDVVETYAALNWTLYTRGDYALAVACGPPPQPIDPAASTGSTPHTVYRPVPVPQQTVEFRRVDGRWKIDRLLHVAEWPAASTTEPPGSCSPVISPYGPANAAPGVAPAPTPFPSGATAQPAVPVEPAPR